MKVLLVNPANASQDGFSNPPLGLLYLAGSLEANGHPCDVVDGYIEGQDAVTRAISRGYDIVGTTCLTPRRHQAINVLRLTKQLSPKSITVIGGVHPTIMHKQMEEAYPFIDHVVQGEGEHAIVDIANGKEPIHETLDIDSIPFPAWDKVDLMKYPARGRHKYDFLGYKNGVHLATTPRISVIFSRGCTATCRFCSAFWVNGRYRVRSPESMATELEMLYSRFGVRHFTFADDVFSSDRGKTLLLCRIIKETGIRIAFHVTTRVDSLDEELVEAMRDAGCYAIAMGIETGSDSLLNKIHKSTDVATGEKAIRLCNRLGIFTNALLIVGSIGETERTVKETRDFLKRCKPSSVSATGGLWILPGTNVYQEAKKRGLIDDSYWLGEERFPTYTAEHTKEELSRFQDIIWTYNRWVWLRRKIGKVLRAIRHKVAKIHN